MDGRRTGEPRRPGRAVDLVRGDRVRYRDHDLGPWCRAVQPGATPRSRAGPYRRTRAYDVELRHAGRGVRQPRGRLADSVPSRARGVCGIRCGPWNLITAVMRTNPSHGGTGASSSALTPARMRGLSQPTCVVTRLPIDGRHPGRLREATPRWVDRLDNGSAKPHKGLARSRRGPPPRRAEPPNGEPGGPSPGLRSRRRRSWPRYPWRASYSTA
jgi:hypothetical protein